ncbi:hypothetical protein HGT70_04090 [Rosenbergiella collisarenosi]|uniref:glycine-rich domain-containing protein n=1 Tax=Rosenbergiella collisarenosi TaxID=1544695 RepID=UPI001BDB1FC5|nr:hypothetical protein [Rosenbergiella collisarenosi]MBT0720461.1 hypothetical protein [Rosenbergiella collisarenosi]
MANNNFKAFAAGNGANVTNQADWEALSALMLGFQSGKASSAQVNKALRQGTTMAQVLAQFIVDSSGKDALDNGDTATLLANLKLGLQNTAPGRLINTQVFTSNGNMNKTTGAKRWRIRMVGGGGGSSATSATSSGQTSVSSGGGAGAYAEGIYDVTSLSTLAVVVGQGGRGGNQSTQYGADGGTSSVGTIISAPGGKAGLPAGPAVPPYQPVTNNNSDSPSGWNIYGYSGSGAEVAVAVSTAFSIGSRGANSAFGSGGSIPAINNAANQGGGYGAGASGCAIGQSQSSVNGAAGSQGIVIIEEYA